MKIEADLPGVASVDVDLELGDADNEQFGALFLPPAQALGQVVVAVVVIRVREGVVIRVREGVMIRVRRGVIRVRVEVIRVRPGLVIGVVVVVGKGVYTVMMGSIEL
jgi:hypothetical protein